MARPLPRLGGPSLNTASAPAASGGVTLTAGSANAKGTWTDLVSSTVGDVAWLAIQVVAFQGPQEYLCDIGVGAAASEVVIIPNLYCNLEAIAAGATFSYLFPVAIPEGTRIAARCQSDGASAPMLIALQTFAPGGRGIGGCARHEACGPITASTGLPLIAVGAVAHTDTAFSAGELIASTGFDYKWMNVAIAHEKNAVASFATWLVDLGVGASGSEVALVNDMQAICNTGTDMAQTSVCFPVSIAAGSRIAARARCSIATATDRNINVAVWGSG